MVAELFSIRPAEEADAPTLDAYAALEGMPPLGGVEHVYVAVSEEAGDIVGFIRLACDEGKWHVNPVVTYSTWRGYGVGRGLIEFAENLYGSLRLVARGNSAEFYRKIGFEEASWDCIGETIASECLYCDMSEECGPIPFVSSSE